MSYPPYLPKDVVNSWRLEDLAWMRENREQRKTFISILNQAVKEGAREKEDLSRVIIKELDNEYRELTRATDTQVIANHIRYVDGAVDEVRGRTGNADKVFANAQSKDNGIKPRAAVRYRWEDEPGKDHVGDANSNGPGEAGPAGVLPVVGDGRAGADAPDAEQHV